MHKKSVEAQQTLSGDDPREPVPKSEMHPAVHPDDPGHHGIPCRTFEPPQTLPGRHEPTDVRSESIAALRAKALEHSAKLCRSDSECNENTDQENNVINIEDDDYKSGFANPRVGIERRPPLS